MTVLKYEKYSEEKLTAICYQWLKRGNLDDAIIYEFDDITQEELDEFKDYILSNSLQIRKIKIKLEKEHGADHFLPSKDEFAFKILKDIETVTGERVKMDLLHLYTDVTGIKTEKAKREEKKVEGRISVIELPSIGAGFDFDTELQTNQDELVKKIGALDV